MKLLYAEDEPAMSEAVVDILEYHNYSVDAVYDGPALVQRRIVEAVVAQGIADLLVLGGVAVEVSEEVGHHCFFLLATGCRFLACRHLEGQE